MLFVSRLFVFVLFTLIGLCFWATTLQLYLEFAQGSSLWTLDKPLHLVASARDLQDQPWFLLLTHYSDLFLFFPVFGVIALIAFFTPAAVLVDIYWNPRRQGKHPIPFSHLRFGAAFVLVIALSIFLGQKTLGGSERTMWQLKPTVLKADKGAGCQANDLSCDRVSFLDALKNIRQLSRHRVTLVDLKQNCRQDLYVQPTAEKTTARYCPPRTKLSRNGAITQVPWTDQAQCCMAEQQFDRAVKSGYEPTANRSDTDMLQQWLWPVYVFFLLTLVVISIMLAFRRKRIAEMYPEYSNAVDRGVLVGAIAMLMLPLMHIGFLLSTQLLHGAGGTASPHRVPETFTTIFGIWGALIVVFFLHPANRQAESFSRIMGVIATLVFAVKGDIITDYVVRLFGAGAGTWSLGLMIAIALSLLFVLWGWKRVSGKANEHEAEAVSAASGPEQKSAT